MALLFLSTKNSVHGQSEKLLTALKRKEVSFCFACPENSRNAGFASARAFEFLELPGNRIMQFFALKKYIRRHAVTHLHVFDEKALGLALWLRRFFPVLKIVGDWHERVLNGAELRLKKDNPYLFALTKGKFNVFFCSSPELGLYLGRTFNLQNRIGILPFIPQVRGGSSCLGKNPQAFSFFLHSFCEQENDLTIAFEAAAKLAADENAKGSVFFFVCLEKTQCVQRALELAEQYGVQDVCVCADKTFFDVFYPLADSVLCVSSDGEGDYSMICKAWHDGKALIASDLAVHTKFILSDSMDCALLYPRDDAASLYKCMHKVFADEALRGRLVRGGRRKAGKDLLETMAGEYLKKIRNA